MSSKAKLCQNCGIFLEDPSHHACGDVEIPYCVNCTTPHGNLGSKEQVKSQLFRFYQKSMNLSEEDASEKADKKIDSLFSNV